MRLGYNTNGLAHHDLLEAIELLAEIGYRSVAITLDHGALNPLDERLDEQVERVRTALERHAMRSVVETGARYLLDPRHKHEPTLMSPSAAQRQRRLWLLERATDVAARLGADCVSIWSGRLAEPLAEPLDDSRALERLASGLRPLLEFAERRRVPVGFEPEPGMYIDTMAAYERLLDHLDDDRLRLTLDVGHLHCLREGPIPAVIRRWCDRLVNVHIEDMRAGVHEHLMFGEGEVDFPPILAALGECGYAGGVHVELSRHSHDAPRAARQAFEFLTKL